MKTKQDMFDWVKANPNIKSVSVHVFLFRINGNYYLDEATTTAITALHPYITWAERGMGMASGTPELSLVMRQTDAAQCILIRAFTTNNKDYIVKYVNQWLENKSIDDNFDLAFKALRGYFDFWNIARKSQPDDNELDLIREFMTGIGLNLDQV